MFRHLCPFESTYLCLDIDRVKLRGHVKKHRKGGTILSDATRAPVHSESADIVLCTAVSHHLQDEGLAQVISESRRILKRTGTYIFMDAI
jgi:ubiquinone/menaquinone biosynthesis C-methylase UbiE